MNDFNYFFSLSLIVFYSFYKPATCRIVITEGFTVALFDSERSSSFQRAWNVKKRKKDQNTDSTFDLRIRRYLNREEELVRDTMNALKGKKNL